ncbi:zinc ABC transporter substrate-binding protein [Paracoccus sp. (in: a-proteobacteria)]|uniref:zinc ABC transporter substrate-binding protein n=1 Tax=Paracoccus sp. TaxID=267 RepID=UPI0035B3B00F
MRPLRPLSLAGLTLACALPAHAEAPRVVTDLPAVAALVQQVMGDLGQPETLLGAGSDAHDYQLRPSQARSLQQADMLIWIGPEMTPWLERAATGLGGTMTSLALLDLPGTHLQDFGADAAHDHAHEHGHEGGDEDDHAEGKAGHGDGHGDGDEASDGHDHSGLDPHAWLDPGNARLWLDAIAAALAQRDPEHATTYAANATKARDDLAALDGELAAQLAPLAQKPFVVFHDAYGYFTSHFGLTPAIAVSLGDASTPSAARLAAIRDRVRNDGVVCAFPEANHDAGLITAVIEGTGLRQGAALDPEGSQLPPGPDHYTATLRAMANTLSDCLGQD